MMVRNFLLAVSICFAFHAMPALAEDFSVADVGTAQGYGAYLSEKFEKLDGHQVTVEPHAAEAIGLLAGDEGIILVPTKGVIDGDEDPAVENEQGAPLAFLFMSPRFSPRLANKKIDEKKLRKVQYESDGEVKDATSLILAVRHVEGDDWRLYVYGSEEKPLIDTAFSEADEVKDSNLTVDVTDIEDGKSTLVVTIFKRYKASFEIGN
jgi:hypothetical protein